MKCKVLLGLVAASFLALGLALPAQAEDPIKIGVYLPLTGQNAFGGKLELDGVRLAHKQTPSVLGRDVELVIVDKIEMNEYKTKTMVAMLGALGADRKPMIVMPEKNEYVVKSAANIAGCKTALCNTFSVYDILNCGKCVMSLDAVKKIEEVYA